MPNKPPPFLFATIAAIAFSLNALAQIEVVPAAAYPGTILRIRSDRPLFEPDTTPVFEIGSSLVNGAKPRSATVATVPLPDLPPGVATISLVVRGQRTFLGRVNVLHPPFLRLLAKLDGSGVRLVNSRATSTAPQRRPSPDQRRISFDALNSQGGVIATGEVVHPARAMEVFNGRTGSQAEWASEPAPASVLFTVILPRLPVGAIVNFYEVEPGVDTTTTAGRSTRRLIDRIVIEQ